MLFCFSCWIYGNFKFVCVSILFWMHTLLTTLKIKTNGFWIDIWFFNLKSCVKIIQAMLKSPIDSKQIYMCFSKERNILLNFLVFFIFLTFPWKISWYSYSTYFLQNCCNEQMMCTEYYSCKYVDKDWWNICTYILLNRYTYFLLKSTIAIFIGQNTALSMTYMAFIF